MRPSGATPRTRTAMLSAMSPLFQPLSLFCPTPFSLGPINAYHSSTSVAETLRVHAHKYAELNAPIRRHTTHAQSHAVSHAPAFQQFATMANLPEAQAKGGLTVVPHKYKECCSRLVALNVPSLVLFLFRKQLHCPRQ